MKDKKIIGVIYALPEKLANKIFNQKKDIFIKFLAHKTNNTKLERGHKLLIYVSGSNKKIIGEAIIKDIKFLSIKELMKKFQNRILLNKKELKNYSLFRRDKSLLVLILHKIKRYKKESSINFPITMNGRYITQKEYKKISIIR
jgi:hypothetical protein